MTLLTGVYASRLDTDATGRRVAAVHVTRAGVKEVSTADTVVVACGALSSALLLLRSADAQHPNGLANGPDQVGRNFMRHEMSIVMAVMTHVNATVFQKTLAFSDFYFGPGDWGGDDWDFAPLIWSRCARPSIWTRSRARCCQNGWNGCPICRSTRSPRHSMDFWLQAEDLPRADNRVYYRDGKVHLDLVETNPQALAQLKRKLNDVLAKIGWPAVLVERPITIGQDPGLAGTAHQAGTCRFGTDPATLALNLDCRAHEVDNLSVTDASFFPSIGAVNPTLTIIANALRVADVITATLGPSRPRQARQLSN